jgi:hypothetical protein
MASAAERQPKYVQDFLLSSILDEFNAVFAAALPIVTSLDTSWTTTVDKILQDNLFVQPWVKMALAALSASFNDCLQDRLEREHLARNRRCGSKSSGYIANDNWEQAYTHSRRLGIKTSCWMLSTGRPNLAEI